MSAVSTVVNSIFSDIGNLLATEGDPWAKPVMSHSEDAQIRERYVKETYRKNLIDDILKSKNKETFKQLSALAGMGILVYLSFRG